LLLFIASGDVDKKKKKTSKNFDWGEKNKQEKRVTKPVTRKERGFDWLSPTSLLRGHEGSPRGTIGANGVEFEKKEKKKIENTKTQKQKARRTTS